MQKLSILRSLWLIMSAALVLRVLVTVLFGDNHRPYYEYMTIADNLLKGFGYSFNEWGRAPLQPTSFLPPLYVYWCALFMWLSPGYYLPMYVAQAFVAVSGCVPAYLIGRRMFNERTGLIFSAAYAFYPEMIYLHSRPVSEFLYVVSALWIIYLYLFLKERDVARQDLPVLAFVTGVIGGISILIKEATTVLMVAVLAAVLLFRRPFPRVLSRIALPLVGGVLLVMSPWIIRNAVVQGQFIPIRTGYGITLWLANHHGATGTDKTLNGRYVLETMDREYLAIVNAKLPDDEQERDRVYVAEVKRFVFAYPAEYVRLCARRLQYYLWFDETHPIARNAVYRVSYIMLLLMAVPGAVLAVRRRRLDPIVPLIYAGYLLLYVPVLILPRYRIISITLLLLMAAYVIDALLNRLSFHWHRVEASS